MNSDDDARIVRFAEVEATPWANGLGETRELAAERGERFADGAAQGALLWRISIATISGPSVFSALPGVDRRLMNLGDVPLRLMRGDVENVTLAPLDVLAFAGEEAVRAEAGNGYDLNLMTARGGCTGDLRVVAVAGELLITAATPGGTVAALSLGEHLSVMQAQGPAPLARFDCALASPGHPLRLRGAARVAVIEVNPRP